MKLKIFLYLHGSFLFSVNWLLPGFGINFLFKCLSFFQLNCRNLLHIIDKIFYFPLITNIFYWKVLIYSLSALVLTPEVLRFHATQLTDFWCIFLKSSCLKATTINYLYFLLLFSFLPFIFRHLIHPELNIVIATSKIILLFQDSYTTFWKAFIK